VGYRRQHASTGALVTLALLAFTLTACGSSSKTANSTATTSSGSATNGAGEGITPTTITIGEMADLSGPIPGLFQGAAYGIDAWAAYVNSTGGINGRKIVVDHKDSALNCTTVTNDVKALAASTFAMVGSASAVDTCGSPVLKANPDFPDIPAFLVQTNYASYPNVYSANPQPPGWLSTGYLWIKSKFGAAAVSKYAVLYSAPEASAFQNQSGAAKSVGYTVAYERAISPSDTIFTSDILRMKAEGIEVVDMTDTSVTQVVDFLQQAAQQNFHPDAVVTDSSYDSSFFKLLGNSSDANDLVMPLSFALYLGEDAATVPEITTLTTWMNKTHPGASLNLFALEAWSAGLLFQQALEKAGPDPTQTGLLSALKGITSFNANGLIPESNPGQKIPPHCALIAEADNGKFVRVDPSTGFLCNGTYVYNTSAAS